jgi:hypothetical protein
MCQFKSAICLKDRVFVPDYNSHSKMLEELHIEDDFVHASKVFVRVELVPEDGDKTSDVDEWKLNVDQDVLPDWWNENDCLPRIKAAVKVWCNNHILRTGMHTVRDGIWYAHDNASVEAHDNASVEAHGNASVEAFDNASVEAFDDASVGAHGNASVKAFDDASVEAFDEASVKAFDNASVEAFDDASVKLPKYFQTLKPVLLHDKAICINYKDHTIQSPVKWEQK